MAAGRWGLFPKTGSRVRADSPLVTQAEDELYNVMVMERDSRTVVCGGEPVLQGFAKAMNEKEGKNIPFFLCLKKNGDRAMGKAKKVPEKGRSRSDS